MMIFRYTIRYVADVAAAMEIDLPPFSGPLVSRVCSPFVCHHSAA